MVQRQNWLQRKEPQAGMKLNLPSTLLSMQRDENTANTQHRQDKAIYAAALQHRSLASWPAYRAKTPPTDEEANTRENA